MPITLAKMAANTADVTLKVGPDSVTVVYYPGLITEKTLATLQGFAHLEDSSVVDGFGSLNDILVRLIKSWDVYEDDAETVMFPLDAERLRDLPIPFRTQVLQAMMGDMRPNQAAPQG